MFSLETERASSPHSTQRHHSHTHMHSLACMHTCISAYILCILTRACWCAHVHIQAITNTPTYSHQHAVRSIQVFYTHTLHCSIATFTCYKKSCIKIYFKVPKVKVFIMQNGPFQNNLTILLDYN